MHLKVAALQAGSGADSNHQFEQRTLSSALAQQDCGLVLMCLQKVQDALGTCVKLNLKWPPPPQEDSSEWSAFAEVIKDEGSYLELMESILEIQMGSYKEQARQLAGWTLGMLVDVVLCRNMVKKFMPCKLKPLSIKQNR